MPDTTEVIFRTVAVMAAMLLAALLLVTRRRPSPASA